MLELSFCFKLDWGSYIISVTKSAFKKIGVLIRSMKVLSLDVAMYLYKYNILSGLVLLAATWKYQISYKNVYVGLLVLQSVPLFNLLTHRQNVASLSLFYWYYFGICSSELAQLVPLPYSQGRSTRYSDRSHDFFVTFPRCSKDVYINSLSRHTGRLWNSLPIECFPLTYDLNGLKYRINRHLLSVGSF